MMNTSENKAKWVGWVSDRRGYMVRFVAPTSRSWARRKTEAMFANDLTEASWTNVGYALRTSLYGRDINDEWFRMLPAKDKQNLQTILEMGNL